MSAIEGLVGVVMLLCGKGADLNIVDNVIVQYKNLIISGSFELWCII